MSDTATGNPRPSALEMPQAVRNPSEELGQEAGPEPGIWAQRWALVGRGWETWKRQGPRAFGQKFGRRVQRAVGRRYQAWRVGRRAWLPDERPVFLQVCHAWGGGTQKHVTELMHRLRAERVRPILLAPDHQGRLIWQEQDAGGQPIWCRRTAMNSADIGRLLALIDPRHAHVHHMVDIPSVLLDRLAARGLTPDWTIHDYHAICPRINLSQPQQGYCGEPAAASCQQCLATHGNFHGQPFSGSIETWRAVYAGRLQASRRVFVPSDDVARRIERYLPGLPLTVRPHFEELPSSPPLAVRRQAAEPVRVAVIGSIVHVKGSDRLLACASDARTRGLPLEFHVIGSTDRDRDLTRLGNVKVLGPYQEVQVFELLKQAQCHVAFLPSVWPETFMYTLSVAMAAGFYTFGFDLGAQADRIRAWGHGRALPLASPDATINQALIEAADWLARTQAQAPPPPTVVYPNLLTDYYDFSPQQLARVGVPLAQAAGLSSPHFQNRRRHARLH